MSLYFYGCGALFCIGLLGILLNKPLWSKLLALELMLNALHWFWVILYRLKPGVAGDGWLVVLYVLTTIELTVGLAVLFMISKSEDSCKY